MHRIRERGVWCTAAAVVAALVLLLLLVWATPAWAQLPVPGDSNHLENVINSAIFWITTILIGLSTLFLMIGGALYILAGGDPGQIEKSKTAVKSALIGFALAATAPILVTIVHGILLGA